MLMRVMRPDRRPALDAAVVVPDARDGRTRALLRHELDREGRLREPRNRNLPDVVTALVRRALVVDEHRDVGDPRLAEVVQGPRELALVLARRAALTEHLELSGRGAAGA